MCVKVYYIPLSHLPLWLKMFENPSYNNYNSRSFGLMGAPRIITRLVQHKMPQSCSSQKTSTGLPRQDAGYCESPSILSTLWFFIWAVHYKPLGFFGVRGVCLSYFFLGQDPQHLRCPLSHWQLLRPHSCSHTVAQMVAVHVPVSRHSPEGEFPS